ncbi:PadR family transcriptional regulator [Subtercola sp. YIM 133946]|uniref:PadR family transcriptional regulator n=1 Tax=Subtercola sp. YIM 133946 TaxID=3118909 RepID=UPI002F924E5D
MSVRASILAVLTLGQAYGLQLHAEIEARTARPDQINVGQIYSTLARLKASGLVDSPATTADGLPLYQLTPDGRDEAELWLASAGPASAAGFVDMVQHVLLAASLPGRSPSALCAAYRAAWAAVDARPSSSAPSAGSPAAPTPAAAPPAAASPAALTASAAPATASPAALAASADRLVAAAALAWLDELEAQPPAPSPLGSVRPRRGRRPAALSV